MKTVLGTWTPSMVYENSLWTFPWSILPVSICPFSWMECSKQNNSQHLSPIWTPACPIFRLNIYFMLKEDINIKNSLEDDISLCFRFQCWVPINIYICGSMDSFFYLLLEFIFQSHFRYNDNHSSISISSTSFPLFFSSLDSQLSLLANIFLLIVCFFLFWNFLFFFLPFQDCHKQTEMGK